MFRLTPVSDLDRATIVHGPGGATRFEMPPDVAAEAQRLKDHRAAAEAYKAAREAAEARDARIAERVELFIAAGPPGERASDLTPARAGLVNHLRWIDRARQLAAAAEARNAAIADAAGRHEAARAALNDLEIDVADALGVWIRFGSEGVAPDARVAERETLRSELAQTETMARLVDDAAFELDVAQAAVAKLEAMLPALRADVLVESTTPLTDRIRSLAADLERAYGLLAAMRVAIEGRSGGPRPAKVELPGLPSGKCVIDVTAEPDDVAGWQQALADLEADPLAEIHLLQSASLPEQPAPKSSLIRRVLGGPK